MWKKEKKGRHVSPSDHDEAKPQQILGDYCRELASMEMRILTGWLDACMGKDPRHVQRTRYTCTTQRNDAKQTGSCGTLGLSHCRQVVADQLGTAIGRLADTSRLDPRETFTVPLVKRDAVLLCECNQMI